jgi:hypothetical protein
VHSSKRIYSAVSSALSIISLVLFVNYSAFEIKSSAYSIALATSVTFASSSNFSTSVRASARSYTVESWGPGSGTGSCTTG